MQSGLSRIHACSSAERVVSIGYTANPRFQRGRQILKTGVRDPITSTSSFKPSLAFSSHSSPTFSHSISPRPLNQDVRFRDCCRSRPGCRGQARPYELWPGPASAILLGSVRVSTSRCRTDRFRMYPYLLDWFAERSVLTKSHFSLRSFSWVDGSLIRDASVPGSGLSSAGRAHPAPA